MDTQTTNTLTATTEKVKAVPKKRGRKPDPNKTPKKQVGLYLEIAKIDLLEAQFGSLNKAVNILIDKHFNAR